MNTEARITIAPLAHHSVSVFVRLKAGRKELWSAIAGNKEEARRMALRIAAENGWRITN